MLIISVIIIGTPGTYETKNRQKDHSLMNKSLNLEAQTVKTTFAKFLTSICFLRVSNRSLYRDMWL